MPSLQYVIDTICSRLTVEATCQLINQQLARGQCKTEEIVPLIQTEDRSLDHDSARLIAEAALEDMAQRGDLIVDGEIVRAARS